ncbi:hypothetical protein [Gymnodinialimonas ceratoperidinii]|uniref:Uncharacterized protein n=1 Tax=Gymnodinialimonas ceratoperidinii TaxID=2856823 RepID=A0A8F6Y9N5_9RHOB|nr:hypothetical protein [Gymnodinialimonas ceratoperidinii]QXT38738.1 hypothetical protein KYE46_12430 [Gymnodinialimonas ceratoperidinii]
MTTPPKTEVFFIVDGVKLESQATLLASTLKRHLMPHQKAVAYVREDYRDEMKEFTLEVLEASDVELRLIPNTNGGHAPWLSPYPHGNKILAAAEPRDCDISVFLDTDTVLTEPVEFSDELGDGLVAACVSDYASSTGADEDWEAFYSAFDMPLPTDRVQLLGGRKLTSLPYFNAGVIVFRERTDDGVSLNFGRDWLETALRFEREVTHDYPRPNIDQFTLPILGYLRGMPVVTMGQHMNFNIQGLGNGEGQRQTIAHYHTAGALWKHNVHGRSALEAMTDVRGHKAPEMFLETYGLHARRKNLKHHLHEMAQREAA